MTGIDSELPKQIVQGFAGAFKGLRLYPLQHPAIARQINNLLTAILALCQGKQEIRIGLLDGTLFIDEELFTDEVPAAVEVCRLLQDRELEGFVFLPGITTGDLQVLMEILSDEKIKGPDFQNRLSTLGIQHIETINLEKPEEEQPRKVYGRALQVVQNIFDDVRRGRIPSSAEAIATVRSMVQVTLTQPHALFALSMLKDYDNYTFTHSVNVGVIALAVGRACGLPEDKLKTIGMGGLLHDLGKLKIDREIINKPGRLTELEFEEIRKHPRTGADLIGQMEGVTPEVVNIALAHHVQYNQEGYPGEARGRQVSDLTYMVAIADTYDAMTTRRSYQQPVTPKVALGKMGALAGVSLHPGFFESFAASLGSYPVGSLVRLDSNEVALVHGVDPRDSDKLKLKILFDGDGRKLASPRPLELRRNMSPRIVAEVDPAIRGIQVTDYFEF